MPSAAPAKLPRVRLNCPVTTGSSPLYCASVSSCALRNDCRAASRLGLSRIASATSAVRLGERNSAHQLPATSRPTTSRCDRPPTVLDATVRAEIACSVTWPDVAKDGEW